MLFEVLNEILNFVSLSPLSPIVVDVVKVENVGISLPAQHTFPTRFLNEPLSVLLELTALLLKDLVLV